MGGDLRRSRKEKNTFFVVEVLPANLRKTTFSFIFAILKSLFSFLTYGEIFWVNKGVRLAVLSVLCLVFTCTLAFTFSVSNGKPHTFGVPPIVRPLLLRILFGAHVCFAMGASTHHLIFWAASFLLLLKFRAWNGLFYI